MTLNTDVQKLIDDALAAGHQTTVGYINKNWKTPPAGTQWATHEAKLKQARALLDPVVTPPPPPAGDASVVPATIDATGATDVTAKLAAWIATVPDGSTLRFTGGTYRIHTMLNIQGRTNLTIDCTTPTTLKWTTPVTQSGADYTGNDSLRLLRFADCKNITVKGFTLLGASPMPASGDGFKPWETNVQHMHTLQVVRCDNLVVDSCTIDGSGGGDGINWGNENQGFRSTGVIRNTIIRNAHRCGIALVGSGGLTVTGGRIERIGAWNVDLEPNTVESGNFNTVFDSVTFGPQAGLVPRPTFLAFAGSKDGHGECVNLTVRNCRSEGRALEIRLNSHDYGQSPHLLRLKNVRLEGNQSDSGGVLECCEVDTLNVSGNNIPAKVVDCTNATIA